MADDLDETEDIEDDADESAPTPGGKNYITPPGAQKLTEEFRHLAYQERPALVKVVAWAASNGDRSENADYIYGKRRLREIDRRMNYLKKKLDAVEIVDPKLQKSEKVLFGATVTVQYEDGKTKKIQIVGVDETVPADGKISWISPLGNALLQSVKGDVITLNTPKGEEEIEILKVEYL